MKQVVHNWVPHEELPAYISLSEIRQTTNQLALSFHLCEESSSPGDDDGDKKATFTFKSHSQTGIRRKLTGLT